MGFQQIISGMKTPPKNTNLAKAGSDRPQNSLKSPAKPTESKATPQMQAIHGKMHLCENFNYN